MVVGQAAILGVAFRERLKDLLFSPKPVVAEDSEAPIPLVVRGFHSEIPINEKLVRGWYKRLEQDVLDDTCSPSMLRTEFEYHGTIFSNARLLSDGVTHVSVFDSQNQLQKDYTAQRRLKPVEVLKRAPGRRIAGTTLHLCAPIDTVRGNYAHWLLDGLARWILLEDRADQPTQIDQFLIPANQPSFRESLQALGVSDERMLELPIHETLEFERLVCMSRVRGNSSNVAPGWLIEGYRERLKQFMSPPEKANQRLYISRRDAGSRKFREEEKLIIELEKRGFKAIELSTLGLKEKVELFSQATDVIGLVGAGMMSVMFCPRGSRVVELYPSNFVSYIFSTVSAALGHRHHDYIFQNTSMKSALSRHSGDFDLDLNDFLASLDSWLSLEPPAPDLEALHSPEA